MNEPAYHTPALLDETLELLDIRPDGTYVDLTFGGGGHSRGILSKLSNRGRLVGFDQDRDAQRNTPDDARFTFVESNFRFMRGALRLRGITEVDGILADLGVSSHHFDAPERGFSFRSDEPLDMRMNQRALVTAADVVNSYDAPALIRILRDYGELESPHRIAGCIVHYRTAEHPITTTSALVDAVHTLIPRGGENKYLSKLFQAIRIEVNHEMDALEMMLEQSLRVLRPEGRLAILTYHSLEDRMVKNFMRNGNFTGTPEKDFYGRSTTPWQLITRKAVVPTPAEVERNPRSRSAKLRVAAKR